MTPASLAGSQVPRRNTLARQGERAAAKRAAKQAGVRTGTLAETLMFQALGVPSISQDQARRTRAAAGLTLGSSMRAVDKETKVSPAQRKLLRDYLDLQARLQGDTRGPKAILPTMALGRALADVATPEGRARMAGALDHARQQELRQGQSGERAQRIRQRASALPPEKRKLFNSASFMAKRHGPDRERIDPWFPVAKLGQTTVRPEDQEAILDQLERPGGAGEIRKSIEWFRGFRHNPLLGGLARGKANEEAVIERDKAQLPSMGELLQPVRDDQLEPGALGIYKGLDAIEGAAQSTFGFLTYPQRALMDWGTNLLGYNDKGTWAGGVGQQVAGALGGAVSGLGQPGLGRQIAESSNRDRLNAVFDFTAGMPGQMLTAIPRAIMDFGVAMTPSDKLNEYERGSFALGGLANALDLIPGVGAAADLIPGVRRLKGAFGKAAGGAERAARAAERGAGGAARVGAKSGLVDMADEALLEVYEQTWDAMTGVGKKQGYSYDDVQAEMERRINERAGSTVLMPDKDGQTREYTILRSSNGSVDLEDADGKILSTSVGGFFNTKPEYGHRLADGIVIDASQTAAPEPSAVDPVWSLDPFEATGSKRPEPVAAPKPPDEIPGPDPFSFGDESPLDVRPPDTAGVPARTADDEQSKALGPREGVPANSQAAGELRWVHPEKIGVNPGIQYKRDVDPTTGAGRSLADVDMFDVDQAGVVSVWERLDGTLEVVHGHHRLDLAKRARAFTSQAADGSQREVPRRMAVKVLKEADGWTLEQVRRTAAIENLRNGDGTALDAAMVLRELGLGPEDLGPKLGVSVNKRLGRDAAGLLSLTDEELDLVARGRVAEDVAAGVGSVDGMSPDVRRAALIRAAERELKGYEEARTFATIYKHSIIDANHPSLFDDADLAAIQDTVAEQLSLEMAVRGSVAKRWNTLRDGLKLDTLAGEVIDTDSRRAGLAAMGKSKAEVEQRLKWLFERMPEVRTERARLAAAVKEGTISGDEATKELTEFVLEFNKNSSLSEIVLGRKGDAGAGSGAVAQGGAGAAGAPEGGPPVLADGGLLDEPGFSGDEPAVAPQRPASPKAGSGRKEYNPGPGVSPEERAQVEGLLEQMRSREGANPEKITWVEGRDTFRQGLIDQFGYTADEADAVTAVADARARQWARERGLEPDESVDEWYRQTIGAVTRDGELIGIPKAKQEASRAAMNWMEDGRAVITALQNKDTTSALHELGHVFRKQLNDSERAALEKAYGIDGGKWDYDAEEQFALDFETYMAKGKAPSKALGDVFRKIAQWFQDVYKGMAGAPGKGRAIDPGVRSVIDRMLGGKGGWEAPRKVEAPDGSGWRLVSGRLAERIEAAEALYATRLEEVREKVAGTTDAMERRQLSRQASELVEERQRVLADLLNEADAVEGPPGAAGQLDLLDFGSDTAQYQGLFEEPGVTALSAARKALKDFAGDGAAAARALQRELGLTPGQALRAVMDAGGMVSVRTRGGALKQMALFDDAFLDGQGSLFDGEGTLDASVDLTAGRAPDKDAPAPQPKARPGQAETLFQENNTKNPFGPDEPDEPTVIDMGSAAEPGPGRADDPFDWGDEPPKGPDVAEARAAIEEEVNERLTGELEDWGEPMDVDPEAQRLREQRLKALTRKTIRQKVLGGGTRFRQAIAYGVGTVMDRLRTEGAPGSAGRAAGRQIAADLEKTLNLAASYTVKMQSALRDAVKSVYGARRFWSPRQTAAELEDLARKIHRGELHKLNERQRAVHKRWVAINGAIVNQAGSLGVNVDRWVDGDTWKAFFGERVYWYGRDTKGQFREMTGSVVGGSSEVMTVQEALSGELMDLKQWTPFTSRQKVAPERFFPRVIKKEVWDAIREGRGPIFDLMVRDVAAVMNGTSTGEIRGRLAANMDVLERLKAGLTAQQIAAAERAIKVMLGESDGLDSHVGRPAKLERQRLPFELPEEYYSFDWDQVTGRHIQNSSTRLARAKVWGREGLGLIHLLEDMQAPKEIARILDIALGAAPDKSAGAEAVRRAVSWEGTWQALSKLTGIGTTVKQLGQMGATIGISGVGPSVKAAGQLTWDAVQRLAGQGRLIREIRDSGAIESAMLDLVEVQDASQVARKMADWGLTVAGVKPVDTLLRYHGALAGRIAVEDAVRKLVIKGERVVDNAAKRFLTEWVMLDEEAVARLASTRKLTKTDLTMAYHAGSKTQIRSRASDQWWKLADLPWARVLGRFQQFNYGQMRVLGHVWNEATRGNVVPLVRMTAAYAGVGWLTTELHAQVVAWIGDKEKRELPTDLKDRVAFNILQSGMFGLFSRAGERMLTEAEGDGLNWYELTGSVLKSVGPVLASDLMNLASAADKGAQTGDWPKAGDYLLRRTVVPYKRIADRAEPDYAFIRSARAQMKADLEKEGYSSGYIKQALDSAIPNPPEFWASRERREWLARQQELIREGMTTDTAARQTEEERGRKPEVMSRDKKERREITQADTPEDAALSVEELMRSEAARKAQREFMKGVR